MASAAATQGQLAARESLTFLVGSTEGKADAPAELLSMNPMTLLTLPVRPGAIVMASADPVPFPMPTLIRAAALAPAVPPQKGTTLATITVAAAEGGSDPSVSPVRYLGPIVITKGGTYTGNWESQNPGIPVVQINTTEPVIIENCRMRGRGNLVSALRDSTSVTVRNCVGESLNPNVLNGKKGRFVMLWKPVYAVIERNTLLSTAGIYINNGNSPTKTIRVRFNVARNIDGRISDGQGGYLAQDYFAQFVQLNNVKACPDAEIAWNEIVNEPRNSRVADNINIYLSSGTPNRPILIHNNFVRGAYPMDPASSRFSGGGIIVDGGADVLSDAAAYIKIYDNQVVGTSNHGISIAAGHHVEIVRNRLISSGLLADGTRVGAANVGLYAWNYYKSADTMFSNTITENSVGWVNAKGSVNNWWFPDCAAPNCSGNQPIRGPITQSMEDDEYVAWRQKISIQDVKLGSSLQP